MPEPQDRVQEITVWCVIGPSVNTVTLHAASSDVQIRDGGVGLVVLRDGSGRQVGAHSFRRCERISVIEAPKGVDHG